MPQMPAKGSFGEGCVREKGERICLPKRLTNRSRHGALAARRELPKRPHYGLNHIAFRIERWVHYIHLPLVLRRGALGS